MGGVWMTVVIVVIVGAGGAVALGPLALPWPERVRWTVVSQAADPFWPLVSVSRPLDLREVTIASLVEQPSRLRIGVLERSRRDDEPLALTGDIPDADLLALLHDWMALGTPLLLWLDRRGGGALYGPAHALADLRVGDGPPRIRPEATGVTPRNGG
jgi:hypothetical protein